MAKAVFTVIELHPGTLFDSDGVVRRWMVKVTAETKAASKAKAPPRRHAPSKRWPNRRGKGLLNKSIRGTVSRTGPLQNVGVVSVNVPYAKYVLGGTAAQGTRYIYRNYARRAEAAKIAARVKSGGAALRPGESGKGLYMKLPLPNPAGGTRRLYVRVHGQQANNFLFDGYNEMARVHEAFHPFANRYAF